MYIYSCYNKEEDSNAQLRTRGSWYKSTTALLAKNQVWYTEGQSVTVNPRGPGKDTTAAVKTNKTKQKRKT